MNNIQHLKINLKMKFKNLEDKCLYYRGLTDYKLLPNSNIIVMLDGKNFSSLIKNNFKKPFDDEFINMMNKTAQFLCNNVQGVKFAYVQSDEISLLITDYDTPETDIFFGGRLCKIQSILASLATSEFNRWFIRNRIFDKDDWSGVTIADLDQELFDIKLAQFDCKVWPVPSQNDAFAWFLYRQIDCIRNSKQQFAQTYCSHKELVGKDTDMQVEFCKEKSGNDWNVIADEYKYGRFVFKSEVEGTATLPNGQVVNFTRNKFNVVPAFELTEDMNRYKFFDIAFTKPIE